MDLGSERREVVFVVLLHLLLLHDLPQTFDMLAFLLKNLLVSLVYRLDLDCGLVYYGTEGKARYLELGF